MNTRPVTNDDIVDMMVGVLMHPDCTRDMLLESCCDFEGLCGLVQANIRVLSAVCIITFAQEGRPMNFVLPVNIDELVADRLRTLIDAVQEEDKMNNLPERPLTAPELKAFEDHCFQILERDLTLKNFFLMRTRIDSFEGELIDFLMTADQQEEAITQLILDEWVSRAYTYTFDGNALGQALWIRVKAFYEREV